jgi:hypothetical protein
MQLDILANLIGRNNNNNNNSNTSIKCVIYQKLHFAIRHFKRLYNYKRIYIKLNILLKYIIICYKNKFELVVDCFDDL